MADKKDDKQGKAYTRAELERKTTPDLRKIAEQAGVDSEGTRDELIDAILGTIHPDKPVVPPTPPQSGGN